MLKSREELIEELTDIKLDEVKERIGLDSLWSRYDSHYQNCKSKAEYEVNIGAYPPKK